MYFLTVLQARNLKNQCVSKASSSDGSQIEICCMSLSWLLVVARNPWYLSVCTTPISAPFFPWHSLSVCLYLCIWASLSPLAYWKAGHQSRLVLIQDDLSSLDGICKDYFQIRLHSRVWWEWGRGGGGAARARTSTYFFGRHNSAHIVLWHFGYCLWLPSRIFLD